MTSSIKVSKFPKSGTKFSESIDEVNAAEHNFNVILQAGRVVSTKTLLSHFADGMQIKRLEDMVADFQIIFSIIRRDMKSHNSSVDFTGMRVADKNVVLPRHITIDRYDNICPLTLLLQIIAESLNKLRINVRPNDWSSLRPLRDVLVGLQQRLKKVEHGKGFFPGLAPCIMLHEEHSIFTVAATSARYMRLQALDSFGRDARFRHIDTMKARCTPEAARRMTEIERFSNDIRAHLAVDEDERDKTWHNWENPFRTEANRAVVNGMGASFEPQGKYKVACVLDYWRFRMQRPQQAEAAELAVLEAEIVKKRGISGATSCAEWDLWITKLSSPSVQPQPPLQPIPYKAGMPKSGTWGTPLHLPPPPAVPQRAAVGPSSRVEMSSAYPPPIGYPSNVTPGARREQRNPHGPGTWPTSTAMPPLPGQPLQAGRRDAGSRMGSVAIGPHVYPNTSPYGAPRRDERIQSPSVSSDGKKTNGKAKSRGCFGFL
ncbi:uncharacterized protein CTRU02_206266 [Colletotrichum truncatum]|uniref:Uncharacterized protein n=1 Tax=Colletotrichum truncatum TaxID=5467 RepID=A0ACC3Z6D9_COLTU|nr:uncharacterized protein CTRU02_09894 [Colletotrichum truncatum]KAF6788081.1 hypothetical protein CTRU02_09894 [Colletotrichum truncatum]